MLDKNVDLLLIGRNHFSYMLGIDALGAHKKVLIVADERLELGPWFSQGLGDIERFFLKRFKPKNSFSPLINIERFLKSSPIEFSIDRKRFLLGRSPTENLTEIFRKFNWPLVDIPEHFDYKFERYCEFFASNFLLDAGPKEKDRFDEIFSFLGDKLDFFLNFTPYISYEKGALEEVFFENFLELMTARFHLRAKKNFTQIAQRHLFLSFLSQRYCIDSEHFLKELDEEFIRLGGVLEESTFKSWSLYKGRPWAVELESFQGLIYPKNTVLLGDTSSLYEVQMPKAEETFRSLEFSLNFKEDIKSALVGKTVLFGATRKIGTEFPFFEASLETSKILIKAFFKHKEAARASFLKKEIISFVLEEIFKDIISVHLKESFTLSELKFSRERLSSSHHFLFSKHFYPQIKHPNVKNVYYMDPSQIGLFGPFSAYLSLDALSRMNF